MAADAPGPVLLRQARDVHSFSALHPLGRATATLSGLVTRRHKAKGRTFLQLRDTTGSVQVVLEQDRLGTEGWEAGKAVKKLSRITVSGPLGRTQTNELSVFADSPPTVRSGNLESSIEDGELSYSRVGAQILASRLRDRAEQFFRTEGFVEIEPSLLSASWGSSGLEPLRVRYEGFGIEAYLAPSPSSQLTEALFVTGLERVFAVSRCFTTTYREERSSAESVILMAKAANLQPTSQRKIIREAVTEILGDIETLPEDIAPLLREWSTDRVVWPPSGTRTRTSPTFEIFEAPDAPTAPNDGAKLREVVRLVWPEHRIVAEGTTEIFDEALEITTITLHVERLVSLLRDVPIRQLRHLGRTEQSAESAPASSND